MLIPIPEPVPAQVDTFLFPLCVSGRKQFQLYAPSDAVHLYTEGSISRIHPNGLINYEGEPTAADGRIRAAVSGVLTCAHL